MKRPRLNVILGIIILLLILVIVQQQATINQLTTLPNLYKDRIEQGILIQRANELLKDHDAIKPLAQGITTSGHTSSDVEIWKRAKDTYEWLGKNYNYCLDKGFCFNNTCYQLQYYSPDELLIHQSIGARCGDCDDRAQLFAGILLATGVPSNRVAVACGRTERGGHCWNLLLIDGVWIGIDVTCANTKGYVNMMVYSTILNTSFPEKYEAVGCFEKYHVTNWYTVNAYHEN